MFDHPTSNPCCSRDPRTADGCRQIVRRRPSSWLVEESSFDGLSAGTCTLDGDLGTLRFNRGQDRPLKPAGLVTGTDDTKLRQDAQGLRFPLGHKTLTYFAVKHRKLDRLDGGQLQVAATEIDKCMGRLGIRRDYQ